MFRNKATSEIIVDFSSGQAMGDVIAFKPGQPISGQVTIRPENDVNLAGITVALGWHTEGRGDRDAARVEEITHMGGFFSAGSSRVVEFNFTAPPMPWSYAGQLINIVWAIEIHLDQERGRTFSSEQPIIISPTLERLLPPTSFA